MRQVVLAYYRLPGSMAEPVEVVVNPQGVEARSRPQASGRGALPAATAAQLAAPICGLAATSSRAAAEFRV